MGGLCAEKDFRISVRNIYVFCVDFAGWEILTQFALQ
jgi:hypothetical protein